MGLRKREIIQSSQYIQKGIWWKSSIFLHNKSPDRVEVEGPDGNTIKHVNDMTLNGRKLQVYLIWVGRQGCRLSPPLFPVVLEVLAGAVRQEKKTKGLQTGKEVKVFLFGDEIISAENSYI